jgi:predicted Zn-dependent protease
MSAEFPPHKREFPAEGTGQTLHSILQSAFEANDGAMALRIADRLLDGDPPDATALLMKRAEALRMLHRLHEAEEILRRILRHEPNNADAHFLRACCHFDGGRMAKGWHSIGLTLLVDPAHPMALDMGKPLL